MAETSEQAPLDLTRLTDRLRAHLSQEDVRELCFRLRMDFENLPGSTKDAKIRELVIATDRQKRMAELLEVVEQQYPYIDLNIQQVLDKAIPAEDPIRPALQSLIGQFRAKNERLKEWKELHNHVDEVQNVFGQFYTGIERSATRNDPIDAESLSNAWRPVQLRAERALYWAENEAAYLNQDGFGMLGSGWRREFSDLLLAISHFLQETMASHAELADSDKPFVGRWLKGLGNNRGRLSWWMQLRERTREFDDALKKYLYQADKELRRTAEELYNLSNESFWS